MPPSPAVLNDYAGKCYLHITNIKVIKLIFSRVIIAIKFRCFSKEE